MDYQVVLTASARRDLQDIIRYISIDDPEAALQFGRFLIHHTRNLSQFPKRGRVVPELSDESIREIIVRRYRIVYRVDHHNRLIQVIRFWHARRGVPEISTH
jgi:toxin ParE1/3/4